MTTAEMTLEPWYRQFWPWFLISIPACTVIACMYTISLAISTSDSLVLQAERGIDVVTERHLDAEQRAADLGLVAGIDVALDTRVLSVDIAGLAPTANMSQLVMRFSHPAFSGRDFDVVLSPAPSESGVRYVGYLPRNADGRWYVILEDAGDWRLSGTWNGSRFFELSPRGAR